MQNNGPRSEQDTIPCSCRIGIRRGRPDSSRCIALRFNSEPPTTAAQVDLTIGDTFRAAEWAFDNGRLNLLTTTAIRWCRFPVGQRPAHAPTPSRRTTGRSHSQRPQPNRSVGNTRPPHSTHSMESSSTSRLARTNSFSPNGQSRRRTQYQQPQGSRADPLTRGHLR